MFGCPPKGRSGERVCAKQYRQLSANATDKVEDPHVKSEFVGRGARAPEVAFMPKAITMSEVRFHLKWVGYRCSSLIDF